MSQPTDLNAERKRRAGLADTGRCPNCGEIRFWCRISGEECPATPAAHEG